MRTEPVKKSQQFVPPPTVHKATPQPEPPRQEEDIESYLTVDEFCNKLRDQVKKAYADARSAGLI